MIIDSHCHTWRIWPVDSPPAPDRESRGIVEQLIHEMDVHGIDQAAIVCARVAHNPDNNDYVAEAVRKYPSRLHQLADVDCFWSETYQKPGGAQRLAEATGKYKLKGFTHYFREDDDGSWMLSKEGLAFFAMAEKLNLIASLYVMPRIQAQLREVAERFPGVPFLVHHMGWAKANEPPPHPLFNEILASSRLPNIYVKLSGFHYASPTPGEYPFPDCRWIVRGLYEHFGPDRLCWGSDYPMSRFYLTYGQTLEAVRIHCDFIAKGDLPKLLGENLHRLLAEREKPRG